MFSGLNIVNLRICTKKGQVTYLLGSEQPENRLFVDLEYKKISRVATEI